MAMPSSPYPAEHHEPRVLLFGLSNETTTIVLRGLIAGGHKPLALVVPDSAAPHLIDAGSSFQVATPSEAPVTVLAPLESNQIVQQAWAAGLPVLVVRDLDRPDTVRALAELAPDVGVVACFSRRIAPVVLELFSGGVLNIHPSLLPFYRGPAPLFWQLWAGETAVGVTVHLMDNGLDTGAILGQKHIVLPDGTDGPDATRLLTAAGVEMIIEQLDKLRNGSLAAYPQPSGGSYYGWPKAHDFTISTDWSVRRAFNFMRGTSDWGRPYRIDVSGRTLRLAEALGYSDHRPADSTAKGEVWIRLADGDLNACLAAELGPLEWAGA